MASKTLSSSCSFGLDEVNVSFLDATKKTLPLVISPRWNDSLEFIQEWLKTNRTWVDTQILTYGAVLIRGFQIDNPVAFEQTTLALQPALCDAYRGTSPRSLKEGTKYAFSAADVPVNYPIAQHLEMSFLKAPPRQLYFGCIKESKSMGGETALCDFRKVYQDLPTELRDKFASKKILYSRKHYQVGERYTYDVAAMLCWPQLFGTADQREVETICQEEDSAPVQWVGPNKDTFLQEWVDEPFQKHPDTNETVWFNHSQVFHYSTFPCELWYAFKRIKDFHLLLHCIMITIFTFVKYGLLGYKMNLNTTFGDGTPITLKEMNQVRAAIHKNMVFSRWQKGDILCIDNFSTSHGRQPTYDKGRQVIVAWSHPFTKGTTSPILSTAQAATPMVVVNNNDNKKTLPSVVEGDRDNSNDSEDEISIPGLESVSPDNSPASTLTKEEASGLKDAIFTASMLEEAFSKRRQESKLHHHKRIATCPDLMQVFEANTHTDTATVTLSSA